MKINSVKVMYMTNNYSWKKFVKQFDTKESARSYDETVGNKLAKLINNGRIKDYSVISSIEA